jgi:hypothetical protein
MQDIATIRKIIESHPDKSRRFISQEVCRAWDWRQANGVLKDMVCRSLLLRLESKGYIKLPARKFVPHNPLAKRKKPSSVIVDQTPIQCSVSELFPMVETFVDTKQYCGTCYKADNWIRVAETTDLGKLSKSQHPLLCKKDVYIHPLTGYFRREL